MLAVAPSHVQAQGLFSELFGFGGPKPAPAASAPHRAPAVRIPAPVPISADTQRPVSSARETDGSGGTYRTVCVRTCDGFYVPISYATRRENFTQDQAKCRSTCGGEAQLFYHRNPGGSVDDAVDLSGRPYGRLANAFKFRKTRVEGCACRPPPWSETELARHQSYASAATNLSTARGASLPTTKTAGTPSMPVAAATTASSASSATAVVADAVEKFPKREFADKASPAVKNLAAASQLKIAAVDRKSRAPAPRIGTGTPTPVVYSQSAPAAPTGGGGLFGMGLTSQPKLKWPGD